jgi:spermidine synthase
VGAPISGTVGLTVPDSQKPSPFDRVARGLPLLVAVSGGAALVYESVWMRSFGLIFGNTTDAVAMVLAVFMGGLALGSALVSRRRSPDPLRSYALLELAIGAAAILTLPLLRALPWAYGALAGRVGLEGPLELGGRVLLAGIVLLPATVLLGMTVPLAVESLAAVGRPTRASFGRLYLLNTLGGAAGVALGPFLLVPHLGVRGTLLAAALGSLGAGALALHWRREVEPLARAAPPAEAGGPPGPAEPTGARPGRILVLGAVLAAASGTATFGVEVLWARSYALVIGSSVYAFNLMLLAVLLGIAGGAALYGRARLRIEGPVRAVGGLFVAAGLAVVIGQWAIGYLPEVYLGALSVLPVSFAVHQIAGLALCLATMLPVTLMLGLTFPLLMHLVDAGGRSAQEASGRLYAWNTAGAIVGALLADLVLVPRLGLQPPYLVFAALLLAGGGWALTETTRWPPGLRVATPAALLAALLALAPAWKPWDPVLMSSGVHRYGLEWRDRVDSPFHLGEWLREQQELVFYREGAEAVVAVSKTQAGRLFLSVNGKTDAGSGAEDVVTQRFIAHVPMLLHPAPRRALVIGWGAGATAASAAQYPLESLECVEIEPAVYEAAPFFEDLSGDLRHDERFRITFRDGRNRLLRAGDPWDVIVSEPSNPWISGVSNLFTREFYEVVLGRLASGGIFGQWFHYYHLDPADVKVEVKTFLSVFPHASLWLVPPVTAEDGTQRLGADMLLVGSATPHALDWERLRTVMAETAAGADLRATRAIGDPLALVASWTMGREEMENWVEDERVFPSGTPLNTDDHPWVEFAAPRRTVVTPLEASQAASAQRADMSAEAGDPRSVLLGHPAFTEASSSLGAFYRDLAERYAVAGQPTRALKALDTALAAVPDDPLAHTRAAELLLERGQEAAALGRLRVAVRMDPESFHAWDLLGQLAIDRRDYPLAEEAHRAMLRREPGNVDVWLRLAAVLARQEKWSEAREALVWARRLDPAAPIDAELERYIAERASAARS